MRIVTHILAAAMALPSFSFAQQYAGDFINNSLPQIPGAEIAYFRIQDPAGKNNNLTLINYYSWNSTGQRIVESKIQRAVIVVHGLNRDPGTYESNALSALNQVADPNINFDTVAVLAPYFPNGDDKNVGYPWTTGLAAGLGSTTNALVWPGSQWSAGGNAQYPNAQKNTISSYYVLDTLIKYFDNTTLFPNVKQIVVAGHSLGAQTVHRYAAIGNQLSTKSPVTYWVANPNSYVWMNTTRPFDTSSCPTYDVYREGYTNFTQYPMTYATSLVAQDRSAILANFNSKGVAFARGLQDLGDDSSSCAPFTTGGNRNERFFNFIKAFPPTCSDPSSRSCDTIDLINVGHDSGQMMASSAGQARLFVDNFYGDKKRAFDYGYPRVQAGDDPFPDPSLNGTSATINNNTYAGNMSYYGCYSDQTPATLPFFAYDNSSNTIELCAQTCNALNYSIAGVEYGSQCFCGNALSSKAQRVVESSCSFPCAANSSEICGGFSRVSIFSRGPPVQLPPPNNPDTLGTWNFWNCYTEGVDARALGGAATGSDKMTLDSCAAFCKGYKYFGTEYGSECYCGNSFGPGANITNKNECNMLCSGNNLQLCGASYRLSVYVQPGFGSSVSVSTGASSTASATASATAVSCPASNGTLVASNGSQFLVECFVDHVGGDMASTTVDTFQQCIDACATTKGCVDVSLSGVACYLKSTLGEAQSNVNIWGAKYMGAAPVSTGIVSSTTTGVISATSTSSASLGSTILSSTLTSQAATSSTTSSSVAASPTPITCPPSNNTVVVSNGSNYLVECFVDRYGGDMGLIGVSSFRECIDACAASKGCVDVSLAGTTCYMKSQLGEATSNTNVWAARYLAVVSSSTSVLSSTSTQSSSTTTSTSTSISFSTITTSATASTSTIASFTSTSSPTATVVTCPGSNNTIVTTANGTYHVECGTDHYGGDLALFYFGTFLECIDKCSATTSCVAVSYAGNACYLKSTLGAGVANSGVWGATLFVNQITASSSSAVVTISEQASSTSIRPTSTSIASTSLTISITTPASSSITSFVSIISSSTSSSTTTIVSSLTTSTAGISSPVSTFSYLGCFVDGGNRALSYSAGSSSKQTPEQCAINCRSQGYKYSGTEYSSECWCSNQAPSTKAAEGDCSSACSGDAKQLCGGGYRLSVYIDPKWVQTLYARQSYKTWNLAGCYSDAAESRTLPQTVDVPGGAANATIANCLTACAAKGYSWCGAEYYSECYGSTAAPTSKVQPGNDALAAGCNYPCTGNSTEACGGAGLISVYINNGTLA